ncbi:hypothetical protein B0A55_07714 [Friedmanniomyces simplex]|uniref:Uncharacterized protein n=1 Tax=Friedmanniomyces simplex TaxID=329884 RepID=A0A4U0X6J2_9PEZI|nr:hypothetical protein B0A55_07714 [Friedmanniomyces simplex]
MSAEDTDQRLCHIHQDNQNTATETQPPRLHHSKCQESPFSPDSDPTPASPSTAKAWFEPLNAPPSSSSPDSNLEDETLPTRGSALADELEHLRWSLKDLAAHLGRLQVIVERAQESLKRLGGR